MQSLSVKGWEIAGTGALVAPSITTQPKNATVTAGQAASFSVTAMGTAPLAYQWRADGSEIADAAGAPATLAASISISAALSAAPFGHVVIVLEENANYASVVGETAAMPYLNSLIGSFGLATQYYSNTHPSIGNYMMLVTGQVLTNDDSQTPASFPAQLLLRYTESMRRRS
jgi:hypothetical protein